MISTRDIDDIIGAEAHDQDDAKIGKVGQIYIDQETEQPVWVSVRSGLFGRSETLVPLTGATWDRTALRLAVPKDRVKDAPRVEPGAEVTPEEQERLYDYYAQADRDAHADRRVRDDRDRDGRDVPGDRGDLDRDDRGDRVAHAADLGSDRDRLGQDDGRADTSRVVDDPVASDRDRYTAAGGGEGPIDLDRSDDVRGDDRDRSDRSDRGLDDASDGSMVRSEEQVHVGTERVATSRARLKRYTVTEMKEVTVPVTREEVSVDYEPTDAADTRDPIQPESDSRTDGPRHREG